MNHLGPGRLATKGLKAAAAEYLQVVIAVGGVMEGSGERPVTKTKAVVKVFAGVTENPSRLGRGLETMERKVAEVVAIVVAGVMKDSSQLGRRSVIKTEYLPVVMVVAGVMGGPNLLGQELVTKKQVVAKALVVMIVAGVTEASRRLRQGLVKKEWKVAGTEYLPVMGNR